MSIFFKIIFITISIFIAFVGYSIHLILQPPELKEPLPETWWTNRDPKTTSDQIVPFKIHISDQILNDLKQRLELTRLPAPSLENSNFTYGFNSKAVQTVLSFWKDQYDWRQREQFLNKFSQFTTDIQGLKIHFLHVKPKSSNNIKVIPLLLLHGWPGSVVEFYRIIPILTTPQNGYAFEVIAPSLPGYGFSEAATKPGLGTAQMAIVMKNLMSRIGYQQYMVQGGDWGALIAQNMAVMFPDNLLALHSNMCVSGSLKSYLYIFIGSIWPDLIINAKDAHRMYPFSKQLKFIIEESGYFHIQASKPDTVGVALTDSPIGLAIYILEKFSTWVNPSYKNLPDGGLTRKFTLTELLDNVMVYWVTKSITTSVRLYSESFKIEHLNLNLDAIPINVPSACARFPHEINYTPESILKLRFLNLVQSTHLSRGGHFAAFEEPELLADDIFTFVKKLNLYL